ncbi:uncharacterized protein LAESUDRAFT_765461 [Laetiporus sulphureus 93-53]|uniref:Uncharacterized protein n=1 Tax=Laetiporus sulphureus 93-53 TaxID=1314785 RepID=A0A165AR29_9APHY|nr:uncharacterized protein LAESUDRAFT_765461 [Laetiporus sulphureus 93-53]KZS99497.1 hypothetical protein LAESUDRAFT_765461 [Laetiporus sulphureus 93-53]
MATSRTLLFLNVLEVVLAMSVRVRGTEAHGFVTIFITPLTSILLTRFVLNLRCASSNTVGSDAPTFSLALQSQSVGPASRIVGNMDADLAFDLQGYGEALGCEEGWDADDHEEDSEGHDDITSGIKASA